MASTEDIEMCDAGERVAVDVPEPPSWEFQLRKYLMLLATLVATATYAAGLSPPGGVWEETATDGTHTAGVPILSGTPRYLAFFYFNATAFAASVVVNLLLLVLNERGTACLTVLRSVMVLDLLSLMGAYATGSCRDKPMTIYASALVVALAAYVGIHILLARYAPSEAVGEDKLKEQRKVLMLLATFAVEISYGAGLSPPGGFRDDGEGGGRAGDLALQGGRLLVFFYCNTTAFVASLLIIVLLMGRRVQRYYAMEQLCGFILVALLGLLGAYAAESSRALDTTAYVIALAGAVTAYIFLVMLVKLLASDPHKNSNAGQRASNRLQLGGCQSGNQHNHQNQSDGNQQHSPSPIAGA